MATKKTAKKPTTSPVVEPIAPEVEPVVEAEPEPEPDDADVDALDGPTGLGYYQSEERFVRVVAIQAGQSVSLGVVFVSSEEPAGGYSVAFQPLQHFESTGWKRIAREDVPLAWRRHLCKAAV